MAWYFSWNAYWTYKQCPERYQKIYITKVPVTKVLDHYNLIYGVAMHELVELFYKSKLWKLKKECVGRLKQIATKNYTKYIQGHTILWGKSGRKSESELLEELLNDIPKLLTVIKEQKLLSLNVQAEADLRAKLSSFTIGGRADLLVTKPEGLFLIDGKSSKNPRPEHRTQLIYYTLCYYLANRAIPKFVGIWYFRKSKIQWLDITLKELEELRDDIIRVKSLIRQEKFPRAKTKNPCFWCDYNNVCGKSQDHLETEYGQIVEAYL
jgi:CRISPR/Cas system-associated exonuclease Cas4 (RecB family)